MKNIRFISTSTVLPESYREATHKIELTPWDLQLLLVDPIQKGLLFLKPTPSQKRELNYIMIDHLKTSLSRTLDFFFPLAGRLATIQNDDNTTSFFIDCNCAGAQFIHATADGVTVADIIEPLYVPRIVHSFFPLNGVRNYEGISKPLLAVQVTELIDGIFIGCTINHTVVDGTSFWHFFNFWSEVSRGSNCISRPPVLKRWFLNDSDCPIRIPFHDEQLFDRFIAPPTLQERVFHFTKEKIAGLKAKANAEIGTDRISSLQALLAHLWRSVIRSQGDLDVDKETSYRLLIGMRPRLHPPLPEQYFGNAVQVGTVTINTSELLRHGLGWAAWQMNKMVALHAEEKVRNFLESWVKNPKVVTVGSVAGNALVTGSSPRFNVFGTDFGWGRPVAVRSGAGNKSDGKLTVFPGVEDGSVDIEASLLAETLQAMGNDAEFMDAITI